MRDLMRWAAVRMAAVAGTVALVTGMTVGSAAAATTLTSAEAVLPANAGPDPQVDMYWVACASAGNCAAVGYYTDSSGNHQGLLLTQASGTWTAGVEAPLPGNAGSNPGVFLDEVSCASAGNCTAVGSYTDSSGDSQGLLLTLAAGTWSAAEAPLPGNAGSNPGVELFSVSCVSAGNCTAVGVYTDSSGSQQGLLLTETAGTWTAAEAPLPGDAGSNPNVFVSWVACVSAASCTAVGSYADSSRNGQGLLLTEASGTWTAAEAPLPANAGTNPQAAPFSVACPSAGNCTAVGSYHDSSGNAQGLLLTQASGTWTAAEAPLPPNAGTNPGVGLFSVACTSAGNCTTAGAYTDTSGHGQGVLLTQASGTWAAAEAHLPAKAAKNPGVQVGAVSCGSAGNCTAVGIYTDSSGSQQGLLLTQTFNTWTAAKAPLPGDAGTNPQAFLNSVACTPLGTCAAVGGYTDGSGNGQGLLLKARPRHPVITAIAGYSNGPSTIGGIQFCNFHVTTTYSGTATSGDLLTWYLTTGSTSNVDSETASLGPSPFTVKGGFNPAPSPGTYEFIVTIENSKGAVISGQSTSTFPLSGSCPPRGKLGTFKPPRHPA